MKMVSRWLVWKEVCSLEGIKKPRKIPYYVSGTERGKGVTLDSHEDVSRLASFDEAIAAISTGEYAGLGFALGPDGTGKFWQGIDVDDLPARAELKDVADDLPGYTEFSPSGKGMHAIGYGRAFKTLGANKTGIEAYCGGRFFTVTADRSGRHPPTCIADFVEQQLQPLHSIRKDTAPQLPESQVVDQVSPKTVTELRSALFAIRSDDRELWIRMGLALKKLGEQGRGLWLDWSQTSPKFDPADASRTWEGFEPSATGYKAVFAEAQRQGWINPLCTEATGIGGGASVFARGLASSGSVYGVAANDPCIPPTSLNDCLVSFEELVAEDATLPHVVDKWIPQNEVTLLAGHGGRGKSYIALCLCVMVALGKNVDILGVKRSRVLFFSGEDGKDVLRFRLSKICRVLNIDPLDLKGWLYMVDASDIDPSLYRDQKFSATGKPPMYLGTPLVDELALMVKNLDTQFVVIDNASDTFDGNEIVRKEVRGFIRMLRSRIARPGRAVLLLAHISKPAASNNRETGSEDYSGSTAWHNSVRSRLSLTGTKDGSLNIEHVKANHGSTASPILMEWHEGVPIFAGDNQCDGAKAATAIFLARQRALDDVNKGLLLGIIKDFNERKERVPVAMQGSYTAFKTLKSASDFPVGITSQQLIVYLRDLERESRLFRSNMYTAGRKWVECFTCAPTLDSSAPDPSV